jgi:hypothetical protein
VDPGQTPKSGVFRDDRLVGNDGNTTEKLLAESAKEKLALNR